LTACRIRIMTHSCVAVRPPVFPFQQIIGMGLRIEIWYNCSFGFMRPPILHLPRKWKERIGNRTLHEPKVSNRKFDSVHFLIFSSCRKRLPVNVLSFERFFQNSFGVNMIIWEEINSRKCHITILRRSVHRCSVNPPIYEIYSKTIWRISREDHKPAQLEYFSQIAKVATQTFDLISVE